MISREECEARDRRDPFAAKRDLFVMPEGVIYLDGNSLGLLPKAAVERVNHAVTVQWGQMLIKSWNDFGWFHLPRRIGDRIAKLVGAPEASVVASDTISVNLFKVLAAALSLRPGRAVILSDTGNFPSDLYVAQGLRGLLGRDYELRIVEPEEVEANIDETVAAVMVTEVDYRTARKHDMRKLTAAAHRAGALAVWDLAHSAGALPVDLEGSGADFAVGCTYKYLNGGPGAPAFLYVRPDLQNTISPALAGWWGHERPFAFEREYRPALGIARMQCGTQPILSMIALDAALDAFDGIDMHELRLKSKHLCRMFIDLAEERCGRFGVTLTGPRDLEHRGSHVSLSCPDGYAVMQAMIALGVVGDFRAPDAIRFGFTPLFTSYTDVWDAADRLAAILGERQWDTPEFRMKKAVT